MPLSDAPAHVKIAVDLIMILEDHQFETNDVLKALKIVEKDYIRKQKQDEEQQANIKNT